MQFLGFEFGYFLLKILKDLISKSIFYFMQSDTHRKVKLDLSTLFSFIYKIITLNYDENPFLFILIESRYFYSQNSKTFF